MRLNIENSNISKDLLALCQTPYQRDISQPSKLEKSTQSARTRLNVSMVCFFACALLLVYFVGALACQQFLVWKALPEDQAFMAYMKMEEHADIFMQWKNAYAKAVLCLVTLICVFRWHFYCLEVYNILLMELIKEEKLASSQANSILETPEEFENAHESLRENIKSLMVMDLDQLIKTDGVQEWAKTILRQEIKSR